MRGVNISVPINSLSEALATMRKWLDQNDCQSYNFTEKGDGKSIRLFFVFHDDEKGKRFQKAFNGDRIWQRDNPLLRPELDWTTDFFGNRTQTEISTNPIQRSSWCRRMAEEIRTVSDGLDSLSAKETLSKVAATWDRLAEQSETR